MACLRSPARKGQRQDPGQVAWLPQRQARASSSPWQNPLSNTLQSSWPSQAWCPHDAELRPTPPWHPGLGHTTQAHVPGRPLFGGEDGFLAPTWLLAMSWGPLALVRRKWPYLPHWLVLRVWSEHRVAEGHGCTAKLRMVKLQVPPSSGGPELWVQAVTQS